MAVVSASLVFVGITRRVAATVAALAFGLFVFSSLPTAKP
jgi:hypothetical protein